MPLELTSLMLLSEFVDYLDRISGTSKRLEMNEIMKQLFLEHRDEVDILAYLIQGKVAPDYSGLEIGISEKTVMRVLRNLTGATENEEISLFAKTGDLGEMAEELLSRGKQTSFFNEPLTLDEFFKILLKMTGVKGQGSSGTKEAMLTDLLIRSTNRESKYIVKIITGNLRVGVSDASIITALRLAFKPEIEQSEVEDAFNFHPDPAYVANLLLNDRINESAGPTPFIPIKVMLAERLQSLAQIIEKLGGIAALEYKYDGLRIQIHKRGNEIRTFSRGNEETTKQFPEIIETVRKVNADTVILDGEAVPVNSETGEIYPFQDVSRRRGRIYDLPEVSEEIPIMVFLFDIIYLNGVPLNGKSYTERRKMLLETVGENDRLKFATQIITKSSEEAEKFFETSIESGCEGIVAKSVQENSIYRAGNRGWLWIKFKRDYQNEISDTLDLVVIGAFYGHGRRKGSFGALLLASYNKERDMFESVCKIGSGFTDENLSEMKVIFSNLIIDKKPSNVDSEMMPDVWIYPEKVIQIKGAEITLSPVHTCAKELVGKNGLAIRFPRFTGTWRTDKKVEDCTSSVEIYELFKMQKKTSYKEDSN
jgi:DNA ligase-1